MSSVNDKNCQLRVTCQMSKSLQLDYGSGSQNKNAYQHCVALVLSKMYALKYAKSQWGR